MPPRRPTNTVMDWLRKNIEVLVLVAAISGWLYEHQQYHTQMEAHITNSDRLHQALVKELVRTKKLTPTFQQTP